MFVHSYVQEYPSVTSACRSQIMELLKNSIRAVLDRFGVLNVWRAPPIDILVAADHTHLVVRVSDQGTDSNDEC